MRTLKPHIYYTIQGFNEDTRRWDDFGYAQSYRFIKRSVTVYAKEKWLGISKWRIMKSVIHETREIVK